MATTPPFGASLRGLGEPVKEFRELLKDISYRNRQEKERGDLEILKEWVALLRQLGVSPEQVLVLLGRVDSSRKLSILRALLERSP